jgi:hypothetical protein
MESKGMRIFSGTTGMPLFHSFQVCSKLRGNPATKLDSPREDTNSFDVTEETPDLSKAGV